MTENKRCLACGNEIKAGEAEHTPCPDLRALNYYEPELTQYLDGGPLPLSKRKSVPKASR
ncbi:MAG: hypothetical protein Q8P12_00190 [bacterium]|nr:hypothetical protein [bacterium]